MTTLRPELARHTGPDDWPGRWQRMSEIISAPDFDWSTFRQNRQLMKGIETSPSRLDYWLGVCEREGVPKKYMVDDPFGSPIGREMDYGFVSASSAKNAWYAWQIAKRIKVGHFFGTLQTLEIGGGYGGMARAIHLMKWLSFVHLLDAPRCVLVQKEYLHTTCPDLKVLHDTVPRDLEYDLATNTMSFGEMPYAQVKLYFDIIQSQLREGGVFYTANRVRREVDFASYPYDRYWRHEIAYMPNEGKKKLARGYVHCYSVRDHQANSPHPINLLR